MSHLARRSRLYRFSFSIFLAFVPQFLMAASPSEACPLTDGSWGQCLEFTGYQKPDEKPITLHAIVRPASKAPKKEPIYLLAGGPGQAASEAFAHLMEPFQSLSQHHDIVILDQRGTGKSAALTCSWAETPLQFLFDKKRQQESLRSCRQELTDKYHLPSFTTYHAVQDIEILRQKLGHEKITLYGISYGTRVALQYAKLYQSNLAKMILEGVLNYEYTLLANSQDFHGALAKVFAACEASKSCQQNYGDLNQRYQRLQAKLKNPQAIRLLDPFTGRHVEVQIDHKDFDRALLAFLYQGQTISVLPRLLLQAEQGNYQGLFSQLISSTGEDLAVGLYLNIVCSEDVPFWPKDQGAFDPFLAASCEGWPRFQAADDFRKAHKLHTPTLLLSGGLDPVTPPHYAEQLKSSLSQVQHIQLEWFSHNIHPVKCVQDGIRQFLRGSDPIDTCDPNLPNLHFFSQRSPLP
ncbi:MAG: alpha/beta fold hydrolase [Oligoflexus sp.]